MAIQQTLPDFIVNSSATDYQIEPAIATLADGRTVMTWRSFDNGDGLSTCIRARIFNVNGTPAGADFIVNSTATAGQSNPSVTVLTDGNIVFAWESDDTADGSLGCIRTRIFSPSGSPLGADFVANSYTSGQQYAPTITALTNGRFLLTFDHYGDEDGPGDEVYARLFEANGAPVATHFVANSTLSGIQSATSVAALAGGGFVMTWMSTDTGDGSLGCIRARMFNASGTALGADFIVNSTSSLDQTSPSVTVLSDGRIVFTWSSYDAGDGDLSTIRARLYSPAGVALGADFIVNTTSAGAQSDPTIVALADGRFVMAWASSDEADGSDGCIRARLFNLDGTPAGSDFIVNTTAASFQFTPVVTALPNGNFQIAWMSLDTGDGSDSTIRSTIFNPNLFIGTAQADTWVGGNLSDMIYGNDDNDSLYGKDGADIIDGESGNDYLWGGLGADQLIGGAGFDYARYDDANYGNLTINLANSALNLGAAAIGDTYNGIEGIFAGFGNDIIVGNSANNTLYGLNGDDSLDGGAGNDTLVGGNGSDIYFVDSVSDIVTETNAVTAVGGIDLVNFNALAGTFTIGANIEHLTLLGTSTINGTGNGLDNTITGNTAANIIDGAAGSDTMIGGDGNDIYYADITTDVITETNASIATGGNDLVIFTGITGTFTLGANVERLTMNGSGNTNGVGNSLDNTINGNSGANSLTGGDGADSLNGGDGDDLLWGGTGADQHIGGSGIDYARYDDANYGALIIDLANANLNTGAAAGDTYSGIEGIVGGAGYDRIYGDSGNNYIYGGDAYDDLYGRDGNDFMVGGDSDDWFYGGNGADTMDGGIDAFIDYARYDDANYGNLVIRLDNSALNTGAAAGDVYINIEGVVGGAGNDTIYGNALANSLYGYGGNDIIDGKEGNDSFWGGLGADRIQFSTALNATTNVDKIFGFATGLDDIVLSQSIFTSIGTSLDASELRLGTVALDSNDFIVYNSSNGQLFYDANGNGAGGQTLFAILNAGTTLALADFLML